MRFLNPLRILCLVLGTCGGIGANAQRVAPLPTPALDIFSDGSLESMVVQPDGGIVFTGRFTSVQGIPRAGIARLLPDGTVDPDWNPAPANLLDDSGFAVESAFATDDGSIIMYLNRGATIGGVFRDRVIKLAGSGSGAADPGFAADNRGCFASQRVVGAWIYIACDGVVQRRSTHDNALDPNWEVSLDTDIVDLADDGADSLFAADRFEMYKISIANISVDAAWKPTIERKFNAQMVWDGAGALFVPLASGGIAKISTTGTGAAVAGWAYEGPITEVMRLAVDGAGSLYVGGSSDAGVILAKLSAATGTVAASYSSAKGSNVNVISMYGPDRVAFGGSFPFLGTDVRLSFARLDRGVLAPATDLEISPGFTKVVGQPDGGTIVAGHFSKVNGLSRYKLMRLNSDGTLDLQWRPRADPRSGLIDLAVDGAGSVFVIGVSSIDGVPVNRIAKLAGDGQGEYDTSWQPNPNSNIGGMVSDGANALYVYGSFTQIGGVARNRVARISTLGTGAVDPDWNPPMHSSAGGVSLSGVKMALSGKSLFVSGSVYYSGTIVPTTEFPLFRYVTDSNAAPERLELPSGLSAIVPGIDDSVMIGGSFVNYAGLPPPPQVARVIWQPALAIDTAWNASIDNSVSYLAVAGSQLYVAGRFTTVNGEPRQGLASLSLADGALADWIPNWRNQDAYGSFNYHPPYIGVAGNRIYITRGATRSGLAAYPLDAGDTIFADGLD